ncbi:MAG: pteridine reductase [Gammaproteobacteria bacterium]
MQDTTATLDGKTALITGAAHRIGATIARTLHAAGLNLILHYRGSRAAAEALCADLNGRRASSVILTQADLLDIAQLPALVEQAHAAWGRLDVLVNNASSFFPTPVGTVTEDQWNNLLGTNLKAPFFLAQAAAEHLRQARGCIVNIADIHGQRPLKDHPVYSIAKAGLGMLTQALARELGPEVRVNGVAPGAILWPERGLSEAAKRQILDRTALKRHGSPQDIARAVLFLIRDADYMTGQILNVDGGRSLSQ